MNGCSKFKNALNISAFKRMLYYVRGRQNEIAYKYLDDSIWPEVTAAPEPTLIIWLNLGIGKFNNFCRKLFLNFVSLILLILGFIIIFFLKS
jgi:hypothetical protein